MSHKFDYPTVFVSQLTLSLHYPCVFLHYLTVHVTPVTLSYSVFVTPKKLSEELCHGIIYYPQHTKYYPFTQNIIQKVQCVLSRSKDYPTVRVTLKTTQKII